jgi:hypothetical protein
MVPRPCADRPPRPLTVAKTRPEHTQAAESRQTATKPARADPDLRPGPQPKIPVTTGDSPSAQADTRVPSEEPHPVPPRRLLIARHCQASKRTTLSLSSPSARNPSAHAAAQIDDQHAGRLASRCVLARDIEAAAVRRSPRTRSDGFRANPRRTPAARRESDHGRTSVPAPPISQTRSTRDRPARSNYVSFGKLRGPTTFQMGNYRERQQAASAART